MRVLVGVVVGASLSLALPACLSGFSEIRIADAGGGADRVAFDAVRDASEDRLQLGDVADVPARDAGPEAGADVVDAGPPLDAPDVVTLDVLDAGGGDAADAGLDVGAEAGGDGGAGDVVDGGADAPDGGSAGDVVDAAGVADVVDVPAARDLGPPIDCGVGFTDCERNCQFLYGDERNCGACGNRCAPGAFCVRGACRAPTRFVGVVRFDGAAYARDPAAVAAWDALCAGAFGAGAAVCTPYELPEAGEGGRACAAVGGDAGLVQAAQALPPPFMTLTDGGVYAHSTLDCGGGRYLGRGTLVAPSMAVCCAP